MKFCVKTTCNAETLSSVSKSVPFFQWSRFFNGTQFPSFEVSVATDPSFLSYYDPSPHHLVIWEVLHFLAP